MIINDDRRCVMSHPFPSFPISLWQSVHRDFGVGGLQQNHSLQELIFSGQVLPRVLQGCVVSWGDDES